MRAWIGLLLFLALGLPGAGAAGARITGAAIGEHRLALEVVSTPDAMRTGLMFRDHLERDAGMLFVYPRAQPLGFWMRNTRLPLSIAFLDPDGTIRNIEDMAPFDEKTLHRSRGDAQYAIETNRGWFKERGIGPGAKVRFLRTVDAEPEAGAR